MEQEKAFLVGIHYTSFRPGIPAVLLGERMVTPEGCPSRLCYHVRYGDGLEIDIPVYHPPEGTEVSSYIALLTRDEVAGGYIPEVVTEDQVGVHL